MRTGDSTGGTGSARTLPVNLLLKERLCLFVGAGHVAHRKLRTILEHGGRALLVAPEACPEVRDLVAAGRIEFRPGRYDPAVLDADRPFLVYAATDDDPLNERIVRDAAARGILASSASCWREGDFISPSVIPWGRGQVSVTTEGASCRQAKFMRRRLSELLGGERELVVLGVDLRRLDLTELERIRPGVERQAALVEQLRQLAALEEFALLATCNRLELYAFTRLTDGLAGAVRALLGLDEFADRLYVHRGEAAVEHAANVVAGHFSEVVGETEIVGQFRAAFARAFDGATAGANLQNLHDRALALGKRIRACHRGDGAGLPELVARVVGHRLSTSGPRVLVCGAGALGGAVAERLARLPGLRLSRANRNLDRLPEEPGVARLRLDAALARLGEFDQVVTVLGASAPVIGPAQVESLGRPPLFIDLGLPRNVDPRLAARPGVEILDLGHFKSPDPDRERLVATTRAVAADIGGAHA